jgi:hypothetical protein
MTYIGNCLAISLPCFNANAQLFKNSGMLRDVALSIVSSGFCPKDFNILVSQSKLVRKTLNREPVEKRLVS